MASRYAVRQAEEGDIAVIAADPRAEDVAELWACGRVTPEEAMRFGLRHGGGECWVGTVDGVPVCMFGAVPASLLSRAGVPWMVGADELDRHALALVRRSKPAISAMKAVYDSLANVVDARNTSAIRWLRWCGFTVADEPMIYGPDRLPFHPFSMQVSTDV